MASSSASTGSPSGAAPPRAPTVFETRHRVRRGTRASRSRALSPVQIDNLVLLCEVWGFLKYHHHRITGGQLHWDYELFRILPAVLDAADAARGAEE